jgi:hypothetical protein
MKERKFLRANKNVTDLMAEVKRQKSHIEHQNRSIKLLFRRRRERIKQTRDDIYMICSSYESGFGHGVANDGLDLSRTPFSAEHLGQAYQIGYEAGLVRAAKD